MRYTRGTFAWDERTLNAFEDNVKDGPPPQRLKDNAGPVRRWAGRKADARALCLWHEVKSPVLRWKHWQRTEDSVVAYGYMACGHIATYWYTPGAVTLMGPAYNEDDELGWLPAKQWARLPRGG